MSFRITRIDLDRDEEIDAVYAVADPATAEVIRPLTEPGDFACQPGGPDGLVMIRLTARGAHEVLEATGKVPDDNPHLPLTAIVNASLFGVVSSLEGW
jgi:hypothetical protein